MSNEPHPVTTDAMGAEPLTPPSSESAVIPAEAAAAAGVGAAAAQAVVAPAAAIALPTTVAPAAAPTAEAGTTPVISPARRRLPAARAGLSRVLRFGLVVAIFVAGIAFGYRAHLSSQAAMPGVPVAEPATAGNQASPVVREFIAAVATNDADAIRSAVPTAPYKLFTYEIERWEFQEVTSVETLATYEDGTRTATAFVMNGRDGGGNPIAINLVVETEDGNIVSFK